MMLRGEKVLIAAALARFLNVHTVNEGGKGIEWGGRFGVCIGK